MITPQSPSGLAAHPAERPGPDVLTTTNDETEDKETTP